MPRVTPPKVNTFVPIVKVAHILIEGLINEVKQYDSDDDSWLVTLLIGTLSPNDERSYAQATERSVDVYVKNSGGVFRPLIQFIELNPNAQRR